MRSSIFNSNFGDFLNDALMTWERRCYLSSHLIHSSRKAISFPERLLSLLIFLFFLKNKLDVVSVPFPSVIQKQKSASNNQKKISPFPIIKLSYFCDIYITKTSRPYFWITCKHLLWETLIYYSVLSIFPSWLPEYHRSFLRSVINTVLLM